MSEILIPKNELDPVTWGDFLRHINNKNLNLNRISFLSSTSILTVFSKTIKSADIGTTISLVALAQSDIIDEVVVIVTKGFDSDNKMVLKDGDGEILASRFFDLINIEKSVYTIPVKQYSVSNTLSVDLIGTVTAGLGNVILLTKVFRSL